MPEYRITWTIDAEADSPREAARWVWENIFDRATADPDDACVFDVVEKAAPGTEPEYDEYGDPVPPKPVRIDLSWPEAIELEGDWTMLFNREATTEECRQITRDFIIALAERRAEQQEEKEGQS